MLSQQQLEQFQEQGYAVQLSLLSPGEVQDLLADVESICAGATLVNHDASKLEMEPNQGPEGTLVRRICEPGTYYPRFRSLSESKELLDCVEQLLGHNLSFHYSKLNMKPPAIGSVVEWHQDLPYYPLTNTDSLAVLIYLDDTHRHNGCLQVIPGRHHQPAMDHTVDGFFRGKITEPINESATVFLEGRAGSAIFMHGLTPHASTRNSSPEPRRTLILSYRAADAFPIYMGNATEDSEAHVRHVRGEMPSAARCSGGAFPIPRFAMKTKSLFDLQAHSRQQQPRSSLPSTTQ